LQLCQFVIYHIGIFDIRIDEESYSNGGSRVTSEGSFENTDNDYNNNNNNNRGVNSRPINVGPSYAVGSGGAFTTSEQKKYSFASSTANKKEEEESTFIASGPPLETGNTV